MQTLTLTPKDELHLRIRTGFGLDLPRKRFAPDHSTPFDFVADAFFNPHKDVAAWSSRSGGKTLSASIIAALEFLDTDGLQARVLSGSQDQAMNLYEYWRNWCNGPLADRLDGTVKRLLTNIGGGKFEILAASQRKVRGGKVHRLYEDEFDEIDPDIDSAAVGMIASRDGLPGRTIYTSTWHRSDGPMSRLVDACPENGVTLHRWNLWEAIERCPVDRHDEGRGCETCPFEPACRGKARQYYSDDSRAVGIAADAYGFYQIDDATKAYRKVSQRTWEAEFLCQRPSADGLVFGEFDPLVHAIQPRDVPRDLKIYRAIDWGLGVFVCLWIGQDAAGRTYLLDTYRAEYGTLKTHAEYILAHRYQRIAGTYCDPAGRSRNDQTGRSNIEEFRRWGIPCTSVTSPKLRNVQNGLALVRAALAPAAGPPTLRYLAGDGNRMFARAMQSYRNRRVNGIWIDQPQDPQEFEHIPDALRYFFVNRTQSRNVDVIAYGAV
ncbi:MAG: hypothetical protein HN350_09230 [Phycisphaerales bacterium]|jgi:hypothetical protein|nr:hypothetical protein [Phycisphaerales bacterium]